MKTLPQILLTAIVAALVSYGVSQHQQSQPAGGGEPMPITAHKLPEKIRCGYIVYPPLLIKDPKTGQFSGIFYDLTQRISEEIGIPVEWTMESSFGAAPTDLAYKKFDVLCSGIWIDPKRARVASFSTPVYYSPFLAYVRGDDTRLDGKTLADLTQDKTLKAAVVDGEFSDITRKNMFPSAQVLAEPNNASISQLAEDVAMGKADITFIERSVGDDYLKANPGKLKELSIGPLYLGETAQAFNKDDRDLRELFDVTIHKLHENGFIAGLLTKYETAPGAFYRVAKPYEAAK